MVKYEKYGSDARGLTVGLVALMVVAVVGTIVLSTVALAVVAVVGSYLYQSAIVKLETPPEVWAEIYFVRLKEVGVLTTLLVLGTALVKSLSLSQGGASVARSLGGVWVGEFDQDLGKRRLRNVVEELAIAVGMKKAPPVYVLDDEPGVNAFAAGLDAKDAVIGVTRGAVDRLPRDQLQGVVAHEFSHILNGDVRLNLRLLGVIAGVQALSFVALYLLRLGSPMSSKKPGSIGGGKNPLGMALCLAFGAALWPVGSIGTTFASLITAAVNRQREFLADAEAVHFTRDPAGLGGALLAILHEERQIRMQSVAARIAGHMFFSASDLDGLFATHPALEERIRRLANAPNVAPEPATVAG